mmetsp:Transcript_8924/g.17247  ORF Transcript_8924/g.17247 Transcript_8924/m.17247 type:complete len:255 (+) Transcript_8924:7-771(+)
MSRSSGSILNPHQDRIVKLSERLQGIQAALDGDKSSHSENLEKQVQALELQINDLQEQNSRKFSAYREQLTKIQGFLDEGHEARENALDVKVKELQALEQRIGNAIEVESNHRKESEVKMMKLIDDRIGQLRGELVKSVRKRKDLIDNVQQRLESQLPGLETALHREVSQMTLLEEESKNQINDEVGHLLSAISSEKHAREEAEEGLLQMMRTVVSKIKGEMEEERKTREESEETMLGLIEEACVKINAILEAK